MHQVELAAAQEALGHRWLVGGRDQEKARVFELEEALQRVLASTTGLVVAHRASTVLLADLVALLEGGTITHVGEHRHLLATVPAYRELLAADAEELEEQSA